MAMGGASLQGILDGITVGGDSSIDVVTDPLDDVEDAYWSITAQGSASASIIIELAGYAGSNVLGVYDKTNAGNQVVLFDGLADKGRQGHYGDRRERNRDCYLPRV